MAQSSPFQAWLTNVQEKQASVLATVLENKESSGRKLKGRLFIDENHRPIGSFGNDELESAVKTLAYHKLEEKNPISETRTFHLNDGTQADVFIDVYMPPAELMIFGAGHDAVPLAAYAQSLGFDTTIVDPRRDFNSEERFPSANRMVCSTSEFPKNIRIGRRTYVVVMNHHLERDQETLKFTLRSAAPYIGVLGPRSRRKRMMDTLQQEGTAFDTHGLSRMYSPVGLDIGAVSPEEIAISILGEVIAIKNGHTGGFLQGSEYIHQIKK